MTQNDGWIEWKGGDCPVNVYEDVEVTLRKGTVISGTRALDWGWQHSDFFDDYDIVAYRLCGAKTPDRANPTDIIHELRSAKEWVNNGNCCGERDSSGHCAAPACTWGSVLRTMHAAADEIERLRALEVAR